MKNYVYRFRNQENEIIYIGKAKNLEKRLNNHKHLSKNCYEELAFIEYTTFDTEHEMDFAERYYIQKLNPKYNDKLSNKKISFNCEELNQKFFKIYEINQYVVERTMQQIELLKKENMVFELNISIVEFIGILVIKKSDSFLKYLEQDKDKIKSYHDIKKIHDTFFMKVISYIDNLKNKYYLLNIEICYKDIKNIGKYLNVEKNEYTLALKYNEKYKTEYKELDFIIRCI